MLLLAPYSIVYLSVCCLTPLIQTECDRKHSCLCVRLTPTSFNSDSSDRFYQFDEREPLMSKRCRCLFS